MPVFPVREVGSKGVITSAPAGSLDAGAWDEGRNVLFTGYAAVPSPTFVRMGSTNIMPVVHAIAPMRFSNEAFDVIYTFGARGECGLIEASGAYTDVTPESQPAPAETTMQYTWGALGNVLYVNRPDIGIRYVKQAGERFSMLPNMDSDWTCQVLRPYKDFLIALNVNKGGVQYSNLVKWSNAALNGQVPSDWDYTLSRNPESLAGENPIAEMFGPIVDGLTLGDFFIVYGRNETWYLTYTGSGDSIFTFRRLFGEGSRGPNCAVEVEGSHFVFGQKRLFFHDGTTITPIQPLTNGRTVYQRVDADRQDMCFIAHDVDRTLVLFCYPTVGSTGCNEAFAYNYVTDTGSFIDLPQCFCAAVGSTFSNTSWTDLSNTTWNSALNSWSAMAASYAPNIMWGGAGASQGTLWLYQNYNDTNNGGADLDNSFDTVLSRSVLNLDAVQAPALNLPVRGAKRITAIQPIMGEQGGPVSVLVSGGMNVPQTPSWQPVGTFDGAQDYKLGSRLTTGRWLGIKWVIPAGTYAELVGYDLEWLPWGGR